MSIHHLLPLLLLSGLSSPTPNQSPGARFGDFNLYERMIRCLPRQEQQMAWQLRKLSHITRECYSLRSPPPCEGAPESWDASVQQIINCMSDSVGPSMQLLSLLKTMRGLQPKPEDCIEVEPEPDSST